MTYDGKVIQTCVMNSLNRKQMKPLLHFISYQDQGQVASFHKLPQSLNDMIRLYDNYDKQLLSVSLILLLLHHNISIMT